MRPSAIFVLALLPLALATACASSGAVNAALKSDLGTLRRNIHEEQRTGALDQSRAKKIAQAVAEREVYAGTGPGAVARIRSLRACTLPVESALEARADKQDEAAAEATLVLLAAHRVSPQGLASRYEDADSGAWRAVAARASVDPERYARRRRYYVDPDQRVRRAALEAAVEAPASLDEAALLEAARLDPDAQCRSLATRAVGAVGSEHAVRSLVDLWDRADEDDRLNLVEAFGDRRAFKAGGRTELLRIADSERGVPAVAARGLLQRLDTTAAAAMTNLLARDITSGSADEQELAIQMAPLQGSVLPALQAATHDADPTVRVAALERLLDAPKDPTAHVPTLERLVVLPLERSQTLAALRKEAQSDTTGAARAALARAGDRSVQPTLVKELAAPGWQEREDAGQSLISLGDFTNAATLLADDDANVRVAIACRILGS